MATMIPRYAGSSAGADSAQSAGVVGGASRPRECVDSGERNGSASACYCAAISPHGSAWASKVHKAATSTFHVLESVLGAMGHAVLAFDCAGTLVLHNRHAADLFGIIPSDRTIGDLLKRNLVVARHDGKTNGADASVLESALKGEHVRRLEVSIPGGESTQGRFALTTHPLGDGPVLGTVAIFEKLHGHEPADEATLVRARDAGLEASRLRSEFAANMSHELRTPLNAIIGMTDMLLGTELGEEQREYARTVAASAQALLRIVEDVLDFSRISAGELKLEQAEFKPAEVVEGVVEAYAQTAGAKGIELSAELDATVPEGPLVGDAQRLAQVLKNLVDNALKFTARGEVTIRVSEETHTAEQSVLHFLVRDTGIGIPPDAQRSLFRVFSKGDSSLTRRQGGIGLGLALSARIVEAMDGTIGVESTPGKGSLFWFTAALRRSAGAGERTSAPRRFRPGRAAPSADSAAPVVSAPAHRPVHDAIRILVAEDNPVNQRVMLTMLQKLGYGADTVANGLEAVTAVTHRPYDIVLMDCQMPELDGYEATRRIRDRGGRFSRVPIVGVTAHALPGDREKCLAAGMDEYLSKPLRMQDLGATLDRWLAPAEEATAPMETMESAGATAAPEQAPSHTQDARDAAEKEPAPVASSAPAPASSPIDLNALEQLREVEREGAGEGFVANLIDLFLTDVQERMQAMSAAVEKPDWDVASRMAHAIKGSSGHFGAKRLAELCLRMEVTARERKAQEAVKLFGELRGECERVKAALKSHRGSDSAANPSTSGSAQA